MIIELTDREFSDLTSFVKINFGLDLSSKRAFVQMRIQRFVEESGLESFAEYFRHICSDLSGLAISNFISGLTVNYTHFCREPYHFQYLREEILPRLFVTEEGTRDLRTWCAGCSSGEEPYTLAMTISDMLGARRMLWDMKILATDISNFALTRALEGTYPLAQLEGMEPVWIDRYFVPNPNDKESMLIAPVIKDEVIFRKHNLVKDAFMFKQKFHFIFCRNVMIYFDEPTKNRVIQRFYDYLRPGGYLFIGMSETIDRSISPFEYVRQAIYRKNEV